MSTAQAAVPIVYHYDALDRLASRTPAGQLTIRYFYLSDLLSSTVQSQCHQRFFRAGPQILGWRTVEAGAARNALLVTDRASSVLHSMEDLKPQSYVYMPYGVQHPAAGAPGMPGFTGQQADPTTGHYLLGNGARAFNPVLMRFNSADTLSPFGKGGINAYAYCSGDPVNSTDPSGHFVSKLLEVAATVRFAIRTHIAAAWSPQQSSILRTTFQALSRNPTPIAPMSPARQALQDAIAPLSLKNPFIEKLNAVNRNLASHGDRGLSMSHAREYAELAKSVAAGELSNTAAHVEAAGTWINLYLQKRSPSALVGIVFNYGGAFSAGIKDHDFRATGQALRMGGTR
ncbi:RHS repeat-associated core domain-containing protein [Pseudomonas sp. R1-18]|uniref:RHS repeat-associated core domain-containing protein n=1 Tax=Pseudomonas sp. R1-18 TaxID=1632772 RepID=UPI003DA7FDA4